MLITTFLPSTIRKVNTSPIFKQFNSLYKFVEYENVAGEIFLFSNICIFLDVDDRYTMYLLYPLQIVRRYPFSPLFESKILLRRPILFIADGKHRMPSESTKVVGRPMGAISRFTARHNVCLRSTFHKVGNKLYIRSEIS